MAGEPLEFAWDYEKLLFSLTWEEDAAAGASEIILPAWVKNAGYELSLDGKAAEPPVSRLPNFFG